MLPKLSSKEILPFIVSTIFHPILMPTLGVAIILNSGGYFSLFPSEIKRNIIGMIFALTALIPLAIMPILLYFGVFSRINMQSKRERRVPVMVTAISYYLAYTLFKDFQGIVVINVFLLAATTTVVISLIINYIWKISLHMIGVGGIVSLLIMLSLRFHANVTDFVLVMILLGGFVASSRLYLEEHSSMQIYGGFTLGAVVMGFFFIAA